MLELDRDDPAVIKFYERASAWPRNKMRVYRDPYEEAILVQWATQFGIRRAMRMAAIRLRAEGMTDAAERVDAKADAHVVAMNVLRDLLREGRAA